MHGSEIVKAVRCGTEAVGGGRQHGHGGHGGGRAWWGRHHVMAGGGGGRRLPWSTGWGTATWAKAVAVQDG